MDDLSVAKYRLSLVKEGSLAFGEEPITYSAQSVKYIEPIFEGIDREQFVVLCLDGQNKPIGINVVSIGSVSGAIVHPREVFKPAILANAVGLICFHNHPSGDPTPSVDDLEITERLVKAGDLIGINIIDHIILGDNCYKSLQAMGHIDVDVSLNR